MDYFKARQQLHELGFVRDEYSAVSDTYVNGSVRIMIEKDYIEVKYGKCLLGGYLENLQKLSKDQDLILFEFDNMLSVDFPIET